MNIVFIGLGNMGSGMAANLLQYCLLQNHTLTVFDLDENKVNALTDQGAQAGTDMAATLQQSDIIFTSLPGTNEVQKIAYGDSGIINNAKAGSIWFETSTNDLSDWQQIIDQATHLTTFDAPVTGGAEGAKAGTLTMLVGGDANILATYQDLLDAFTGNVVHMGPSGAGYVAKLAQLHLNYLVAQGIGEAMMLGACADLDMETLWRVLNNSCAKSYVVESYIPKVLDGSYDPTFSLGLARKDMRLINDLGKHLNVPLELGSEVLKNYEQATDKYGFEQPHLSIVKLIEERTGRLLRSQRAN